MYNKYIYLSCYFLLITYNNSQCHNNFINKSGTNKVIYYITNNHNNIDNEPRNGYYIILLYRIFVDFFVHLELKQLKFVLQTSKCI